MYKLNSIFSGKLEHESLALERLNHLRFEMGRRVEFFGVFTLLLITTSLVMQAKSQLSVAFFCALYIFFNIAVSFVVRKFDKITLYAEYAISTFNVLYVPALMLLSNEKVDFWQLHFFSLMRLAVLFNNTYVKVLYVLAHILPVPVLLLLQAKKIMGIIEPTIALTTYASIIYGLTICLELLESKIESDELRLRTSSRLLSLISNNIHQGIIVVDKNMQNLLWSKTAESIFGPPAKIESSHDFIARYGIYHTDQTSMFMPETFPIVKALNGINANRVRMLIKNKFTGSGQCIEASAYPVFDSDENCRGAVMIFSTVSEIIDSVGAPSSENALSSEQEVQDGSNVILFDYLEELKASIHVQQKFWNSKIYFEESPYTIAEVERNSSTDFDEQSNKSTISTDAIAVSILMVTTAIQANAGKNSNTLGGDPVFRISLVCASPPTVRIHSALDLSHAFSGKNGFDFLAALQVLGIKADYLPGPGIALALQFSFSGVYKPSGSTTGKTDGAKAA